jgi:hypothetical protein
MSKIQVSQMMSYGYGTLEPDRNEDVLGFDLLFAGNDKLLIVVQKEELKVGETSRIKFYFRGDKNPFRLQGKSSARVPLPINWDVDRFEAWEIELTPVNDPYYQQSAAVNAQCENFRRACHTMEAAI